MSNSQTPQKETTPNTFTSLKMIGRQVYFQANASQMEHINRYTKIPYLSQRKLYTIYEVTPYSYKIINDLGNGINILLKPDHCAHLCDVTDWIVKKENPLLKKQHS